MKNVNHQLTWPLTKFEGAFFGQETGEITGGMCKVGWPLVTRPVQFGGLGILPLERFSRVLRLRWLRMSWKNLERPWAGMSLPVDVTDITLFAAVTRVTIHNGKRAFFRFSSWIDGWVPSTIYPLLCQHSRRKNITVRDAMLQGKWISDIAYNLNAILLREFFGLWQSIESLQLNLSRTDQADQIIWSLESSGEYSANSAYNIQF